MDGWDQVGTPLALPGGMSSSRALIPPSDGSTGTGRFLGARSDRSAATTGAEDDAFARRLDEARRSQSREERSEAAGESSSAQRRREREDDVRTAEAGGPRAERASSGAGAKSRAAAGSDGAQESNGSAEATRDEAVDQAPTAPGGAAASPEDPRTAPGIRSGAELTGAGLRSTRGDGRRAPGPAAGTQPVQGGLGAAQVPAFGPAPGAPAPPVPGAAAAAAVGDELPALPVGERGAEANAGAAAERAGAQRGELAGPDAAARPAPGAAADVQQAQAARHAELNDRAATALEQIRVALGPGVRRATVALTPAHLGRVDVTIAMEKDGLVAHLRVEAPDTYQALERHLPELRASLERAGLDVSQIDIAQGGADGGATFGERSGESRGGKNGATNNGAAAHDDERVVETVLLRPTTITDARVDTLA